MEKIMKYLKETKILGLIGNVLLAVAVFLPAITISVTFLGMTESKSVSYFQGEGKFILILALINIAIIFADKLSEKVEFMKKLTNQKFTLIPTVISLLILLNLNSAELLGDEYSRFLDVKYAMGYYLMWLGIIASAVYPFLYKNKSVASTPVEPQEVVPPQPQESSPTEVQEQTSEETQTTDETSK